MQHDLVRVAQVEWRLRRAAVKDCPHPASGVGMILDSPWAYRATGQGDEVAPDLLDAWPQVIGVVPGSPAQAAGIAVGDKLWAVQHVSALDLMVRHGDRLPENIVASIGDMPGDAPIEVDVEGAGGRRVVRVRAVPLCPGQTVVKQADRVDAFSDSINMAVTTGLLRQLDVDDQLAFVIGHELAHMIFADSRDNGLKRRDKETRADLYGVHIARCAGYDPRAAIAAMDRIGSSRADMLPIITTHHSYRVRKQSMELYMTQGLACDAPFRFPTP